MGWDGHPPCSRVRPDLPLPYAASAFSVPAYFINEAQLSQPRLHPKHAYLVQEMFVKNQPELIEPAHWWFEIFILKKEKREDTINMSNAEHRVEGGHERRAAH